MKNSEAAQLSPRCQLISKSGSRCYSEVEPGQSYCEFHSKENNAAHKNHPADAPQTQASLASSLPALPLETALDIADLMAETINRFRRGEIDLPAAKAIIQMASLMLRALKEDRLTKEKEEKADRRAKNQRHDSAEDDASELQETANEILVAAYDELPDTTSAAGKGPYMQSHQHNRSRDMKLSRPDQSRSSLTSGLTPEQDDSSQLRAPKGPVRTF